MAFMKNTIVHVQDMQDLQHIREYKNQVSQLEDPG